MPTPEGGGEVIGGEPQVGDEPQVGGEPQGGGEPQDISQLTGVWVACADEGVRSERYTYELSVEEGQGSGQWRYVEERFGEGSCLGPASMRLTLSGTLQLAEGDHVHTSVNLLSQSATLTALTPGAVDLLSAVCPQRYEVSQDVDLSEGCERLGLLSLEACPERYQVASRRRVELSLGKVKLSGADSEALCSAESRPTTLDELTLTLR